MPNNHNIDIAWDEAVGEQVRQQTERAMNLEAQDIRDLAMRFHEQARQREEEIHRIEATLPIMMTITRHDSDGNPYEMSIEDTAATSAARANITRMKQQVAEVRRAITRLNQAAAELERMITETNRKHRELLTLLQQTDQRYAARVRELTEKIHNYNQRITAFRESFDVGVLEGFLIGGLRNANHMKNMLDNKEGITTNTYDVDAYLAYVKARVAIGRVSDFDTADVLGNALSVLPMQDRINIKNIVVNSPDRPRGIFLAFVGYINIADINASGAGFFDPNTGTIHFNLRYDRTGQRGAYYVFFHEVGHMIDWVMSTNPNQLFTRYSEFQKPLFNASQADVRNRILLLASRINIHIDQNDPYYMPGMSAQIRLNAVNNIMAGRRLAGTGISYLHLTPEERFQVDLERQLDRMVSGWNHQDKDIFNMSNVGDIYSGITKNGIPGLREDSYWFNSDGTPTYRQNSELFASHFASYMLNNTQAMQNNAEYLSTAMAELDRVFDYILSAIRQ